MCLGLEQGKTYGQEHESIKERQREKRKEKIDYYNIMDI